jgi:hypothetical protein
MGRTIADMKSLPTHFARAMQGADFVQLNGIVFTADYLRVPDEATVAEDVVMELSHGETELALTREEVDGAQYVGEGVYRLRSGAVLRFLATATLH